MRNKMKNPDILVVGGGASGLIAAITAARRGASVTVLERSKKPLMKLLRTGNGRCNLTNTGSDRFVYHGTDPSFAHAVLKNFSVQETIALFLSLGVYTTNHDGWVYPYSEQAESVAKNILNQVFDTETSFDRCNVIHCTFNAACQFDRCNVIECTGTDICTFVRSNVYDEDPSGPDIQVESTEIVDDAT